MSGEKEIRKGFLGKIARISNKLPHLVMIFTVL